MSTPATGEVARVYIPTTLAGLAAAHAAGELVGHARLVALGESEDEEYDALAAAAEASAALLDGSGRRVVLVAEASTSGDVPVPLAKVVAVHVDVEDVDPDADDLPELAWFATQEIEDLLSAG